MAGLGTTEGALDTAEKVTVCGSFAGPPLMPVSRTDCCGASSFTVASGMKASVGGSLTETTVRRKLVLTEPLSASVTVSVIVVVPDWLAAGVIATMRVAPLLVTCKFELGTTPWLDDVATTIRLPAAVSRSPTVTVTFVVESSLIIRSATEEIVGKSFTGLTVSTNVSLFVACPSLTSTVIVQTPNALGAGVTATARLAPVPLKLKPPLGTIFVSDDEPNNDSAVGRLSTSPTMKVMVTVVESSLMVRLVVSEMVGGLFTGVMCPSKVRIVALFEEPSAIAVTVIVASPLELGMDANVSSPVLLPLL